MPPLVQEEVPLNAHDPEVHKEVLACATLTKKRHGLETKRFTRFSSLASLRRAIANLTVVAKEFRRRRGDCNHAQRRVDSGTLL